MMMTAERCEITFAGPAALFERNGVVAVALGRGHPAARRGAALVAGLDQVPQGRRWPVVAAFPFVVAAASGKGAQSDMMAQSPGPASAARFLRRRRSGRAQPWPTGAPVSSVTVTHQRTAGASMAWVAICRAVKAVTGPNEPSSPGVSVIPSNVASGTVRFTVPLSRAGSASPRSQAGPDCADAPAPSVSAPALSLAALSFGRAVVGRAVVGRAVVGRAACARRARARPRSVRARRSCAPRVRVLGGCAARARPRRAGLGRPVPVGAGTRRAHVVARACPVRIREIGGSFSVAGARLAGGGRGAVEDARRLAGQQREIDLNA